MPPTRVRPKRTNRSHTSLDATLLDRLTARPSWARGVLVRRVAAGLLAAVAVVLFVRDAARTEQVGIVVAAHDLAPGTALQDIDVVVVDHPPGTVPDGALRDASEALGQTVAGPVRAGEPLTDTRVLSSRLAGATVDAPDARVVPVRLSDAGVSELLRSGDTVDVVSVGDGQDDAAARVLATNAVVVLVSSTDGKQRGAERVVLIAMSAGDATSVAAASLVSALTVTLR